MYIVRVFHVYKDIWTPVLYPTQQEHGNPTVSILKDDLIVGHIPQELSRICWHFIARDGEIICKITGQRQKSALLRGGLEILCMYTFRQEKVHQ